MNDIGAIINISGLVQGVGFRYFTYRIAAELGLKGFVRNTEDGSVEVHVEGPEGLVRDFAGRLKIGPRMSRVTGLSCEWIGAEGKYTGFEIR